MNYDYNIKTACVHAGNKSEDTYGAINQPIYMTSNYRIPTDGTPVDWSGVETNVYARNRNVNQWVLQDKLSALEGAEDCVVLASGVSALSAAFITFLKTGDHVVCSQVCYSATNILFRELLPNKYQIEVTFVDSTDTNAVAQAVRPNTKLIHVETPGNPTTGISDLAAVAKIAHQAGALLTVDSTFASPIYTRPLEYGADLVIHSMTKYLNGHGDSLGGCVLGNRELIEKIKLEAMVNFGGILSPFNAWLITRGLATLPLRMKQHSDTAAQLAQFLETHPKVRFIHYPGLKSHPQHELAKQLMQGGYSGMMSFGLRGDDRMHLKFLSNLKLVTHAVSLGDIESLIVHYDSQSPKMPYYPALYRDGFYRFSVGLEDAQDLLKDIENALDNL